MIKNVRHTIIGSFTAAGIVVLPLIVAIVWPIVLRAYVYMTDADHAPWTALALSAMHLAAVGQEHGAKAVTIMVLLNAMSVGLLIFAAVIALRFWSARRALCLIGCGLIAALWFSFDHEFTKARNLVQWAAGGDAIEEAAIWWHYVFRLPLGTFLGLTVGFGLAYLPFMRRDATYFEKRGRCVKCGYDLRGDYSRGCPECGWKRGSE